MTAELLPCPFCGNAPTLTKFKNSWQVECSPCELKFVDRTQEDVMESWNTRDKPDAALDKEGK